MDPVEIRRLFDAGEVVVRVERYEAVVLEPPDVGRRRCPDGQQGAGGFVAGDRPAVGAGVGAGGALMDVVAVARDFEALVVRAVAWLFRIGARHPRLVLWGAVAWLVAGVIA